MIATVVGIVLGLIVMGAFAYVLLNPNVLGSFEFMSILPTIEFPQEIVPHPELVDIPIPTSVTSKTSEIPSLDILDPEMYTHYTSRFIVQNTGTGSISVHTVSYGEDNTISGLDLVLADGQKREITMSNLNGTAGENYLLKVSGISGPTGTEAITEKIVVLKEPSSNLEIVEALVTRSSGDLPTLTVALKNSGMTTISLTEMWLTKPVDKSLWDPSGEGVTLKPDTQRGLQIRLDSNDYITSRVETSQRKVVLTQLSEITLRIVAETDIGGTVSESTILPVESPQGSDQTPPSQDIEYVSLDQYRDYLLSLINNDRAEYGLDPLKLSDNKAAQNHAGDMLKTRKLSHWTTDGMKPYMRYTLYAGDDNVSQNAAKWDYPESSIEKCESGKYQCAPIDVKTALEKLEYSMMYDDYDCCKDGHRHNILDPNHTHVSLGIAYDSYGVYIVQNFENNYVNLDKPQVEGDGTVTFSGKVLAAGRDLSFDQLMVFYDETPTKQTYFDNLDRKEYDAGQLAGVVLRPGFILGSGTPYVQASEWEKAGIDLRISFNMGKFVKEDGSGVYTLYLWAKPEGSDNSDSFMVTSYSIFVR